MNHHPDALIGLLAVAYLATVGLRAIWSYAKKGRAAS